MRQRRGCERGQVGESASRLAPEPFSALTGPCSAARAPGALLRSAAGEPRELNPVRLAAVSALIELLWFQGSFVRAKNAKARDMVFSGGARPGARIARGQLMRMVMRRQGCPSFGAAWLGRSQGCRDGRSATGRGRGPRPARGMDHALDAPLCASARNSSLVKTAAAPFPCCGAAGG